MILPAARLIDSRCDHHRRREAEVTDDVVDREGPVRPAVAGDEIGEWIVHRSKVGVGDSRGDGGPQAVAQASSILDACPHVPAGDSCAKDPTLGLELLEPLRCHSS